MLDTSRKHQDFIAYEYRDIHVSDQLVDLYIDNYVNFGWQMTSSEKSQSRFGKTLIKFKRNRHIANKTELTRLQRKFEAQINQIETLEKNKSSWAMIAALTTGLAGSGFLAASVMLLHICLWLSILLGVIGLIGWALPYWLYRNLKTRQTQVLSPKIDGLYDQLYETCQQAHKLLIL